MKRTASEKKESWRTDVALTFVLTATLAVLIFSRQPPLQRTYDSYDYIAASTDSHTYLTGKNPDGFFYLVRPPLMPMYLHLFDNKILGGALLNVFSFAITVFLSVRLGRIFIDDDTTLGIFILSVVFSYSFLQFHFFLWTEAVFTAIILATFYCIVKRKPVYHVVILLVLAFLFRKAAGFITLGTVAVYVGQKDFRKAVITSGAMLSLFGAWELFTISQIGSSLSGNTWSHHIGFSRIPHLDSLTSWILPRAIPIAVRALLLFASILAVIIISRKNPARYWKDPELRSLLLFWSVYTGSLLLFWGARDFDEADRYLAVALPFFMLILFSFLSRSVMGAEKRKLYFISTLWLLYPIGKCVYSLIHLHFR